MGAFPPTADDRCLEVAAMQKWGTAALLTASSGQTGVRGGRGPGGLHGGPCDEEGVMEACHPHPLIFLKKNLKNHDKILSLRIIKCTFLHT